MKTRTIFAVHKWETLDGLHHVHLWYDSDEAISFYFKNWRDAKKFASLAAKGLDLKMYTIDEPARPHEEVEVL